MGCYIWTLSQVLYGCYRANEALQKKGLNFTSAYARVLNKVFSLDVWKTRREARFQDIRAAREVTSQQMRGMDNGARDRRGWWLMQGKTCPY